MFELQVLMVTRHGDVRARCLALEVVANLVERLREEYLVLLPEVSHALLCILDARVVCVCVCVCWGGGGLLSRPRRLCCWQLCGCTCVGACTCSQMRLSSTAGCSNTAANPLPPLPPLPVASIHRC